MTNFASLRPVRRSGILLLGFRGIKLGKKKPYKFYDWGLSLTMVCKLGLRDPRSLKSLSWPPTLKNMGFCFRYAATKPFFVIGPRSRERPGFLFPRIPLDSGRWTRPALTPVFASVSL